MSTLAQQTAKFKAGLARQDYTSWHSNPSAAVPVKAEAEEASTSSLQSKKKPRDTTVWSQPADTGSGTNINTQLVYAINVLRERKAPMRLEDVAIISDTPVDTDRVLLEKFRSHDKVDFNPNTGLYEYKHEFTARDKASLLTQIQRHTMKGNGVSVKNLTDGWKEAVEKIEELEEEGSILVTRGAKDGKAKMVFWNWIKPSEETGGQRVEEEFNQIWHSLQVPNEVDLQKQLTSEGHQTTLTQGKVQPKGPATKKKGKRGGAPRQRQVRITNTHLKGEIDLSKDFVPPGK